MKVPPIQCPSPALLSDLAAAIAAGTVAPGSTFVFDTERKVLLFVEINDDRAVSHWHLEPCQSKRDYETLVHAYHVAAAAAARKRTGPLH